MFTKQISVVALLRVDLHSHITFSVMETCSSLSCSDLFATQVNVMLLSPSVGMNVSSLTALTKLRNPWGSV